MRPAVGLLTGLLASLAPAGLEAQGNPHDFDVEWRWADFDQASGYRGGRAHEMFEVGDTLWVRGDSGIYWFDGFSWHWVGDGEGLPVARPTAMVPSGSGEIIAVVDGRVYAGGTHGFVPLTHPGWEPSEYRVERAAPTSWGLVLTAETRADPRPIVFLLEEGGVREVTPPDGQVFPSNFWPSADGSAWLNSSSGLFKLREEGWRPVLAAGEGIVRTPVLWDTPEGRGFAFFSYPLSDRGIYTWDRSGTPSRIVEEGENQVVSGTVTSDGLVIAVYESGDVRVLEDQAWSSPHFPPDRVSGVHFVYEDRLGDLWFGSSRGLHLFRRSLRRWTAIGYPFPDSRNRVNGILPGLAGAELWLATHGGLVHHGEDGTAEWISIIGGEEIGSVTGLARDSAGGVWISSGSSFYGAFRWYRDRWERYGPEQGFDMGRVHKVRVGNDGSVWFLSLGHQSNGGEGGVFRLVGSELEHVRDDRGWLDARMYAMAEGPEGTLWFGSGAGLARRSEGRWSQWGPEDGVGGTTGSKVFTLLPDPDGGVWFGFGPESTMGLGRMDRTGSVSYLTVADGLPDNAVNQISRDDRGVIWIATDGGIARFDGEEWAAIAGAEGLNPAKAWPLAFRGNDLLIGTTGGGLRILHRAEEENPPPMVSLEGPIVVEGRTVRVRWRALGYRGEVSPDRTLVRDRFDDWAWSDWGTFRQLWTSNADDLSWGPHRVAIQAKGLYGQTSEPLIADFLIPYPILLRPVYYIPVGGLLLAFTLVAVAYHRRRSQTANTIRESEARLRTLVDSAPDGITIYDVDADRFTDVNRNILRLTGLSREEFLDTHLGGTSPARAPDGRSARDFLLEKVHLALAGEEVLFDWRSMNRSGELIPAEVRLVRLPSAMGNLVRFSVLDIRDRKAADARREDLEAQLRQSQKLEAVGQLTGGVAHDFNNLLTVILGNMDLLKETRGDDPEILELAESAIGAAERSAVLTQRLLAFSRRQALHTRTVDLPDLVDGLLNLLMRSLGERIRVLPELPPGLWPVLADPGHLEHAFINLAVNARDAMPRGGDLYLEGVNVVLEPDVAVQWGGEPGEYVCVSVTDTGIGMEPEVRNRAVDPFFTTKEIGAGSGLGLSMVYGFVKQSGGFTLIHSEPGMGTAVQLFLPRAPEAESTDPGDRAFEKGRGEVILVVEDEPLLLNLTARLAEAWGYEVMEAAHGPEALSVLGSGTRIDLLLTDVVLPGEMDGVELAQAARKLRPGLPVLFTSGYGRQFVRRMARGFSGFELLPKPFDSRALARKLRSSVEGQASAGRKP